MKNLAVILFLSSLVVASLAKAEVFEISEKNAAELYDILEDSGVEPSGSITSTIRVAELRCSLHPNHGGETQYRCRTINPDSRIGNQKSKTVFEILSGAGVELVNKPGARVLSVLNLSCRMVHEFNAPVFCKFNVKP